jgi:acyl carrier protein
MPSRAEVEQVVIEVLKNVSRRPIEPKPASDLVSDLGFDSLQVLEAVAELEGRFDITIELTEATDIRTVAQIADRVAGLIDAHETSR